MMKQTQRWMVAMAAAGAVGCTGDGGGGVNLFTIQDDKDLGAQLAAEIAASPQDYPVLDEGQYAEAYGYLYDIRDEILSTGEVRYAEEFDWELYIIDDPETLNAFAAPGGYIYVYTGLMYFLDQEDELAGVMGHEIAHADRRHSTQQLTKAYGVATLLELVLGEDPGLLAEIASGLVNLSFSREDESEADEYSVIYLCETPYAADGAAGFFEQIEEAGGGEIPEFLSTHPSSADRVEEIRAEAEARGCSTEPNPDSDYDALLSSLP